MSNVHVVIPNITQEGGPGGRLLVAGARKMEVLTRLHRQVILIMRGFLRLFQLFWPFYLKKKRAVLQVTDAPRWIH